MTNNDDHDETHHPGRSCNRIHSGVHEALDRLFVGMVETGAREGQAVIRQTHSAIRLTLKLLSDDEPPIDYTIDEIQHAYSGVWDPVTRTFKRTPSPDDRT